MAKAPGEAGRMLYDVEGLPERRREEWASTGTGTTERTGSLGCAGGKCGGEVSRQKASHLQGWTLSREHRGPSKELEWRAAPNRLHGRHAFRFGNRKVQADAEAQRVVN